MNKRIESKININWKDVSAIDLHDDTVDIVPYIMKELLNPSQTVEKIGNMTVTIVRHDIAKWFSIAISFDRIGEFEDLPNVLPTNEEIKDKYLKKLLQQHIDLLPTEKELCQKE